MTTITSSPDSTGGPSSLPPTNPPKLTTWEAFQGRFARVPCQRKALLFGLVGGSAIGGLRLVSTKRLKTEDLTKKRDLQILVGAYLHSYIILSPNSVICTHACMKAINRNHLWEIKKSEDRFKIVGDPFKRKKSKKMDISNLKQFSGIDALFLWNSRLKKRYRWKLEEASSNSVPQ
ncbi:uncharacterized protein MELLADRAFT_106018 [Melampsora larici-populina 98AG31]|uniref:Uncharacterized protein n=1 Tax=Melampsora larici-populina (strain 98AG31 / pathotype 3-4-7) TaxID=747676 RepID=F4RK39_MELLP|nr:uncharacterized protein MELLADRAFT_106018 [Melampsora larici-populina 98AG31]EGG07032.1 hypothetical protein MELLADRAFT_106018 [Melampsora larici-populina 98AG31]